MANSEIIFYSTPQGEIKIEVILQDETVWLTQRAMGELFGVSKKTISEHLGNRYKSNDDSTRKLQTFTPNAVLITNPNRKSHNYFIKPCKTKCAKPTLKPNFAKKPSGSDADSKQILQ